MMRFKHYIIYGTMGLLMETLFTGVISALKGDPHLKCTTYLWMFFIYGMAAAFEPIHELIRDQTWIIRGLVWAALIFALEYACGYALKAVIGSCPWNYGGSSVITFKGFIRPDFFPIWFIVGLLFERLHDTMKRYNF